LADLPEVVGFFSYSRDDDKSFKGALSALRKAIHEDLSAKIGRSETNFRLWQDQEAIAPGKLWESEIKAAIEQAVLFIAIVTPRAVNSRHCKFEFDTFLARQQALGRADLVFPLLYIDVPALKNEAQWREDPVLSIIGQRQYVDWQPFRYLDIDTTPVREAVGRFCDKIVGALRAPWVSPEEQRQQEAEAERSVKNAMRKRRRRPGGGPRRDRQLAEAAREVARLFPDQPDVYIAPHIPAAKEANARASTGIPQNEVVCILFDYTARGSATNCLIAGESGIFHHHTLADPNPYLISYRKLRDAQIVNKFTGAEIRCLDQPKLELVFSASNKQASRFYLRALQVRLKAVPC
jgi:TIR domain